jgi:hypothetical protein
MAPAILLTLSTANHATRFDLHAPSQQPLLHYARAG